MMLACRLNHPHPPRLKRALAPCSSLAPPPDPFAPCTGAVSPGRRYRDEDGRSICETAALPSINPTSN